MKKCKNCGKDCNDRLKFCDKCATRLPDDYELQSINHDEQIHNSGDAGDAVVNSLPDDEIKDDTKDNSNGTANDITEPDGTNDITEPDSTNDITEPDNTDDITEPDNTNDITEPNNTNDITEPDDQLNNEEEVVTEQLTINDTEVKTEKAAVSSPADTNKSRSEFIGFVVRYIYPTRFLFIIMAVVLVIVSLSSCESRTVVRTEAIPATYEEIEREYEFTAYDPRGASGVRSYVDVIMIFDWFSDTTYRLGGNANDRTNNIYYAILDENMEMGFIQLQGRNTTPRLAEYSLVLFNAVLTGEIIYPPERIYGFTSNMIDMEERLEQNILARTDSEKRQEIEEIYELLDDRLVLRLDNSKTWIERIEITPHVPSSRDTLVETHYLRSTILMAVALLFFIVYIFSKNVYKSSPLSRTSTYTGFRHTSAVGNSGANSNYTYGPNRSIDAKQSVFSSFEDALNSNSFYFGLIPSIWNTSVNRNMLVTLFDSKGGKACMGPFMHTLNLAFFPEQQKNSMLKIVGMKLADDFNNENYSKLFVIELVNIDSAYHVLEMSFPAYRNQKEHIKVEKVYLICSKDFSKGKVITLESNPVTNGKFLCEVGLSGKRINYGPVENNDIYGKLKAVL